MAFIHPYKIHPQRPWAMEETKIPQRAWTLEETKIPHRPNSASRAPRRDFRGAVVVNPSFQRFNEPVDSVREEDMEPQLMEAQRVSSGGHRVAIKRENINVVRECEWDVKSITDDNVRTKTSLSRPLIVLLGAVCITSFVSLLLTLLILFGSVEISKCSCGGNEVAGSTSAMKSVDDERIVEVSENITTLDKRLEERILKVKQACEEREKTLLKELSNLKTLLQQQKNETKKEKLNQEMKFQHLTGQLESTQSELTSLKAHLAGHVTGLWNASNSTSAQLNQLKSVWIAVNATAEVTSNLTKKIEDELNNVWQSVNGSNATLSELVSFLQVLKLKLKNETDTVWLNLNQTKKCCTNLKSSLQSFKQNVTYRSKRLEARIEIEEQKSNSSNEAAEHHFKTIQDLGELLNSTRQDAKQASRRYLAALWSAGNSTKNELQKVWTAVNTSQTELNKKLLKVKHNLTDQLNLTTVLLKSSDASLFASLIKVNTSITQTVNSVSKMAGPIGPPGFNGSQGPAGPAGSIGPRGPKGAGDFSSCQYKVKIEPLTPGDSVVVVTAGLNEPSGKRILGASCSTNFAAEYNLFSIKNGNVRRYGCTCKGTSNFFSPSPGQQKSCSLHYWECPLTT